MTLRPSSRRLWPQAITASMAGCALVLGWCAALPALAADAELLSYDEAWQRLRTGGDRLVAARAAVAAKTEMLQGLEGLGGPSVSVSGATFRYSASLSVDLDPVTQNMARIGQTLPGPLLQMVPTALLQNLPDRYTYSKSDTATTASVSALWPLYVGGANTAMRQLVGAQQAEAQADADRTLHESATLLAQRYFGALLAQRGARLRLEAMRTIEQHDQQAERLWQAGLIARVERLQGQVALEDARRQAAKAKADAALAAQALSRLVLAERPVQPSEPLFVWREPLPPLDTFQQAAQQRHPGLAKVAAKKAEAEHLHEASVALRRPQVVGFAQRQLKEDHPDWVAGIAVRWTLFDSMDRGALDRASRQQVAQAEATERQARSDIDLLVEKHWNAVEQARRQFLALEASLALADEMLRLRQAGLREGTSTTLDLIDAETQRLKVQTERSQAAHDYDVALAQLLESCGQSDDYGAYMARADVKVP